MGLSSTGRSYFGVSSSGLWTIDECTSWNCLYSTNVPRLVFPFVCPRSVVDRWLLPKITTPGLLRSPETWSLAGWDLESVNELGCLMGFCSRRISFRWAYREVEVCLYRLMGRKDREVLRVLLGRRLREHRDFLYHHAVRLCRPCQCQEHQLHLRRKFRTYQILSNATKNVVLSCVSPHIYLQKVS